MIRFNHFFYLHESKDEDRVGIQHLYSLNKPELYSMGIREFKQFVGYLNTTGGMITPQNSTVSEKVDGMSLKVGQDENGFFIQSSYSGKVYSPQGFTTTIKYPPAREAFISSFERIKQLVLPAIKNRRVTIQLEWLYSPNATEVETDPSKVSFVIAQYKKETLGMWSTFVILNIRSDDNSDVSDIEQKLLKHNNTEVKFILPNVELFQSINLKAETALANKVFTNVIKYEGDLQTINNTIKQGGVGRNKLVKQRREITNIIQQQLLPIQKMMYIKIITNLLKTEGLLGDIEGYVIKAGTLMFKVNSPQFMGSKFDL
jgi:hypothetical protein